MDVQSAPPVYTPVGTPRPPSGNPPVLGQQVPGMSGGLPAQSGLSVLANPMAQQLQSYGRGEDTMLVHMTPREVNSLQGLAAAHGGSLTTNPSTGLPEAGWLGDLLPMIIGAVATPLTGGIINPLTAAALMGVGTAAVTGDIGKGLMAGLQTYGGAALGAAAGLGAGSFGIGAASAGAGAGAGLGAGLGTGAATAGNIAQTGASFLPTTAGTAGALGNIGSSLAPAALGAGAPAATLGANLASMAPGAAANLIPAAATAAAPAAAAPSGFFTRFGEAARAGLPAGTPGIIAKNAPMLAGAGVLSGLSNASQQMGGMPKEEEDKYPYGGPYRYDRGEVSYPTPLSSEFSRDSTEHMYFPSSQLRDASGNPVSGAGFGGANIGLQRLLEAGRGVPRFAKGGEVNMARGSFVADARTVSELGNGSSGAGQELLARMGGQPLRGPGDGVSDSIPARIGRDQPARVARDEVLFSPEAVRRIGKGSEKRGAQKLYALMDKAHKARKKAKRGQDTGLRKGLA